MSISTEEVKYSMSLSDMVSGKLDHADKSAKKLEGTMGSLGKGIHAFGQRAIGVIQTLGVSFAAIKFEEMLHEGTEMAHKFDIAVGQLENTIKNVGERAGLSSRQMVDMATEAAKVMPFTKTQFVEMETAISRFGNMTPAVFQKVLALSADVATALHRDGNETAYMLGRIFEAPAENSRIMRQFGITLDTQQRKLLNTLEHTGHVAQAQTYIFQMLAQKGFAGAAEAAAHADPLFRYNKIMERLKYSVGGVGVSMLEVLAPAIEKIAAVVETSMDWFKRHKEVAEGLAIALGSVIATYTTYVVVEKTMAAGEWLLVAAKKAAMFVTGDSIRASATATETQAAEAISVNNLAGAYGRLATAKSFSVTGFGGAMSGVAEAGAVEGVEATAVGASMFTGIGEILAVVAGIGTLLYGFSKMGGGDDPKTKEARTGQIDSMNKASGSVDGLGTSADDAGDKVQTFAQKTSSAINTIQDKINEIKNRDAGLTGTSGYEQNVRDIKAGAALQHFIDSTKKANPGFRFGRLSQEDKASIKQGIDEKTQFIRDYMHQHEHDPSGAFSDTGHATYGYAEYLYNNMVKKRDASTLSKLQKQRDKLTGSLSPSMHNESEVSKVTGNHPVTINIKIDSLVKGFTIATTNLSESTQRIKEEVTKVLLSAVNDSQVVAGI